MKIIAVQMNDIDHIDVSTDTSFALALEAQKRGYHVFYYQPQWLYVENMDVKAQGHFVELTDSLEHYAKLSPPTTLSLSDAQYVLIRQNPPYDLAYITTTHLLELLPPTTIILNNPQGIRNAPEKLLVLHFKDLTPPTLITRDLDVITAFIQKHKTVVLKPLFEFGGQGVLKIQHGDTNLLSIVELYQKMYREPFIIQEFIPAIAAGDKRILLMNGEPVGIFTRIPQVGQTRSNMRVGGHPEKCTYTQRDRDICATIGPVLKKMGLYFVGIDVIGDYLTEINVTSPTGLRVMNRLYDLDLATIFWDQVPV